jgi:hypothetical protein
MSKKLLIDDFFIDVKNNTGLIKESIENGRDFILTGVIQRADSVNANGRIYPRHILEVEVDNYKKIIAENRAWGEADHPDDSTVSLKSTALRMLDIWWDGNEVWGKIKILPTRVGKDIMVIVEDSGVIGISSRGVGETKRQNDNEVVTSYTLVAFDLVCEPSTNNAIMKHNNAVELKREQVENILNKTLNKSDRVYRICNRILNRCDTYSCEL